MHGAACASSAVLRGWWESPSCGPSLGPACRAFSSVPRVPGAGVKDQGGSEPDSPSPLPGSAAGAPSPQGSGGAPTPQPSSGAPTPPPPSSPAPTPPPPGPDLLPLLDRGMLRQATGLPPRALAAGEALAALQRSGVMRDRALALYVNSALFAEAAAEFRRVVLTSGTLAELDAVAALGRLPAEAGVDAVFPAFARFVLGRYHDRVARYRALVQTADLRAPHAWFPLARGLARRIVYHAGPTNSGKTHAALQAMRAAPAGVYCGPLRLLAMEVYDRLNGEGTYCDLVTGQERREVPGAAHVACTVEMSDLHRRVDVAVVDEIQMIGDESRGWAWTRALMGLPAAEIHLCARGGAVGLLCARRGGLSWKGAGSAA